MINLEELPTISIMRSEKFDSRKPPVLGVWGQKKDLQIIQDRYFKRKMKVIVLTIKANSPLAMGRRKLGVVNEAEDYIPGSVIRGAIAQEILQQTGYQNQDLSQNGGDFKSLFLDESCAIFHNAYPSSENQISSVIPATAVSSKTDPGFKHKGNGVFDTLIDRFCAEYYQHPYDPNCPQDQGRVEPFSGFYTVENGNYQTHSISKRLLTQNGINRRRNVAEESILLGSARSRGLGKVTIKATVTEMISEVSSRLENFNQSLQMRWEKWGNLLGKTSDQLKQTYFTVNLEAEAILTNQWRKTTVLTPEMLQEEIEKKMKLCNFTRLTPVMIIDRAGIRHGD